MSREDDPGDAGGSERVDGADDADTPEGWDSDLYDDAHSFVHEYGSDVVDLLAPGGDERILDLGCGTGHLTAELDERTAETVGLDNAPDMIATARETYPDVAFVEADARDFAGRVDGSFDAVFSNAALHWIDRADQPAVARSVRDVLRPGGRFVAELGGTGNVATIVAALREELAAAGHDVAHPWYFPTVGEHATLLGDCGFEVRYARLFDRPTELEGEDGLRNWLSMFGDRFFASVPESDRERVVETVEERLRPTLYREGSWVADYRRLRFVAVVPPE